MDKTLIPFLEWRHKVEYSNSNDNYGIENFSSVEAASTFFENCKRTYRYVFQCELARYIKAGAECFDWIYFKWTPDTDWPEARGRFEGFPSQDDSDWVQYYEP